MRPLAGGADELDVAATSYRGIVRELQHRFPALTDAVFSRSSIAIDGVLIQAPLLETCAADSEVVFLSRISGG
jgi:hypothetical protein